MSILGLYAIGYLAGLAGSIFGGFVDLARMSADDRSKDSGKSAQVIFFIVLYMIFTSRPLQLVKVMVAAGVTIALRGSSHPVLWTSVICAAAAFAFMVTWPLILNAWNRFKSKKAPK